VFPRTPKEDHSLVNNPQISTKDKIAIHDASQFTIVSETSLTALMQLVPIHKRRNLEMTKFRPTIVVKNSEAWAEDTWMNIRINDVFMRGAEPCTRCKAATLDSETLKFDADYEPVKTLITHRNYKAQGCFAHMFYADNKGKIKVGDKVKVFTKKYDQTKKRERD
jgi:uncharacterized protein YcbX